MDKELKSKEKLDQAKASGAPSWAVELLTRLRDLEIRLGNITPEGDWQESRLSSLHERLYGASAGEGDDLELNVELLFKKVAQGLAEAGYTPAATADLINALVPSGGRLPYCNAAEVAEAL